MKTKNKITLIFFIHLIVLLIIASLFLSSCCYGLNETLESGNAPADNSNEEYAIEYSEETNTSPIAEINITQEDAYHEYYQKGEPVFFSGSNSTDQDGDELTFVWKIGDGEEISGEDISYTFDNIGQCNVELTVSDGTFSNTTNKNFEVCEINGSIILLKEHKCSIEIEYGIENKGPGNLVKVQCRVEAPITQTPFQVVEKSSKNSENVEESIDDRGNLIYKFNLKDVAVGESSSSKLDCDVIIYEFSCKDYSDIAETNYDPDDKDLELYTKSEQFIDSNSSVVIETTNSIVGDETNPYRIAEKLYNFVIGKLEYDYGRESNTSSKILNASEILKRDSGTCMDYSILYTALLRAAGIPSKYIQGVPIYTYNDGNDYYTDHAWVEIKLPGYSWIPIDATGEEIFLSHNYFLNLKTYEGTGKLYLSIAINGYSWYPTGYFFYPTSSSVEPDVNYSYFYRVSGIEYEDIGVQ